jgi:Mrp family chromosome partitioning ATPase
MESFWQLSIASQGSIVTRKPGRIITFYSRKGGTGRTTAVSNIAWILASNGYRVLLIDWDLEAPSLHSQLRPFLNDPVLAETPGLVEYLSEAAERGGAVDVRPLPAYAVGLNWTFSGNGAIAMIGAGCQDEGYSRRVSALNWNRFYRQTDGVKVLKAASDALRAEYDYVLIDSRTGVSDGNDIFALQFPDALVFLFSLNEPSIDGAVATADHIRHQRAGLPIFPVPALTDNREQDRLAMARSDARQKFAPFLRHVQSGQKTIDPALQASYWREVETPYIAFYAYEQVPAAFAEEAGSRQGLLASYERITYWITDGTVASLRPDSEERRKAVIAAYALKASVAAKSLSLTPPAPRDDRERDRIESQLPGWINVMSRALARDGWKYATAVLALVTVVVVVWPRLMTDSQMSAPQLAPIASQLNQLADSLAAVADQLQKLEEFASKSDGGTNSMKADLANASEKLAEARQRLNDLRAVLTSPAKNRPPKQAPPAQQRH